MLTKWVILTAIFTFSVLCGSPPSHLYPDSGIETLMLENGMRVALKQTDYEPGEVLVRLMAEGGFADLPAAQRASGEISSQAALRSGISDIGFDKLHALLYEHSVEFETQMQPFSRSLELSADSEGLEQLFSVVNLFFTKSRFSRKAFDAHKRNVLDSLKTRENDSSKRLESAFLEFNTQQLHVFNVLSTKEIESASFEQSEKFFSRCFTNPADFVCVIVGDFNKDETKKLIKQYLEKIPRREEMASPKIPHLPDLHNGIKTKILKNSQKEHAVTRITFPLQIPINQDNVRNIEVVNYLIRERLVTKVRHQTDPKPEIRVSFDFPFYPSFHCSWISIQYISSPKQVSSIGQSILVELKRMQIDGFSKDEIEKVKNAIKSSDRLAQMENGFWLTQIANFMVWNWDIEKVKKDFEKASYWRLDEANKNISNAISLDNYTIISQQP